MNQDKEQILEMYRQGQGMSTIAFKLKISVGSVTKLVRQAGLVRDRKAALKLANELRKGEKRAPYEVV